MVAFPLLRRSTHDLPNKKILASGSLEETFAATAAHKRAHGKSTKKNRLLLRSSWIRLISVVASLYLGRQSRACEIQSDSDWTGFPCLEYNSHLSMFELTCSFRWPLNFNACILLRKDEVFEGRGHIINITGLGGAVSH